jgi:hypothetical protein
LPGTVWKRSGKATEGAAVTFGEDPGTEGAGPAGDRPGDDRPADHAVSLDDIVARPLAEHPDGYEQLHGELRAALAEIDDA